MSKQIVLVEMMSSKVIQGWINAWQADEIDQWKEEEACKLKEAILSGEAALALEEKERIYNKLR